MPELLLELLSEEIPARMQDRARLELRDLVQKALEEQRLMAAAEHAFATPRRLVLVVDGLPEQQPGHVEARFGPRRGAPDAAIEGFKRSVEGKPHGGFEWRADRGTEKLYVELQYPGQPLREVLSSLLPNLLSRFPWPKSMRWGDGEFRWVRPLQSILCLFGGEVVPFELGGIASGDTTRGHRFMAPEPFAVRDFADYRDKLRRAKVMLDGVERRSLIEQRACELAAAEGYAVEDDPGLLDEVKGLVEWPVPLLGRIDEAFMAVPPEALVGTMRANQKYLALRTPEGALAPRFVVVANTEAADGGAAIAAGNERVLRARLWDARFFWEGDRKRSLESRLPALDQMVFHAELGTVGQRVERLVALAGALVPHVPGADRVLAERAALLAKADLVTGMVGEFPELQGIMGAHYARVQDEPEAVVAAIRDHYAPKGPDDRCPDRPVSIVVALADKLDALVGFFAVGIKPSGSGDPFALRRAALGIIRLILENGLRLPLKAAFAAARGGYGERLRDSDAAALDRDLLGFFADRLKVYLRDRGVRHDLIAAAFAAREEDDLVRLLARVEALQGFLDREDGRNLLVAYRRASSIVGIEEKKDKRRYDGHAVAGALTEPAEEVLFAALQAAGHEIAAALADEDFGAAMRALAKLRGPVDGFFEQVMVNAPEPDLRVNRLLLLSQIRSALGAVANFSLIEDGARAPN